MKKFLVALMVAGGLFASSAIMAENAPAGSGAKMTKEERAAKNEARMTQALEKIKAVDEAEYNKLVELQKTDKKAFGKALREYVDANREKLGMPAKKAKKAKKDKKAEKPAEAPAAN